jgi:carbamoyltransferase
MPSLILGISAYYHDSAAALLADGQIIAAAQEERFSRKKHDEAFPARAIRYVLNEAGIEPADLTAVAFYDKPFLKFERLLETSHAFAPRGLKSFLAAMPVWTKEKIFMRSLLAREMQKITGDGPPPTFKLLFPEHHLSHAASAFYPSPFKEAAILTIDGVGEWATSTICHGKDREITILKELPFPHSVGLLYSAFTYYCGFKVNSGEYKLMGLAPYGQADSPDVTRYRQLILDHLVDLKADGSILLNMAYFNYAAGLTMCHDHLWERLFALSRRPPEGGLSQPYLNLALAIQQVTEEIVLRLATTARLLSGCANLVMAGGVALNCVANGKLQESGIFERLWIQPAAGDAGGALGAAYAAHHIWHEEPRLANPTGEDAMQGALLGPEFSDSEVRRLFRRFGAVAEYFPDEPTLCSKVAGLLAGGEVVGWFQGRMEYGPRALGNRSILADPRDPTMQKRLNLEIKFRESFRPFAAVVLAEEAEVHFELDTLSPYMLLVKQVREGLRLPVEEAGDDPNTNVYGRINQARSILPAITHIDYSCRIQTVSPGVNNRLRALLLAFKGLTGLGMLVNTSFNRRGEPIVGTPEEAYEGFMLTGMTWLVINNFLFRKGDQPEWLRPVPPLGDD